MKIWVIYKIISPSNKIYIGQTKNFRKRKSDYKKLRCKSQIKLYNSIQKYGWNHHIFEIIEEGLETIELTNEREKYWITFYDSFNNGLNCTIGGSWDYNLTDEQRKNKSEILKSRWESGEFTGSIGIPVSEERGKLIWEKRKKNGTNVLSEETKKKLIKYNLNRSQKHIENHKQWAEKRKGYKVSEETKEKISLSLQDRFFSEEHRQKLKKNNAKSKKVICLDNGIIYESAYEAERQLNLPLRKVCLVCKKKIKTIKGYKFEYYE